MRRFVWGIPVLAGAALFLPALLPGPARAEVNLNINIGPPAVVVHEPPEMVVMPRSLVYWAPGVSIDLFFYRGYWWTPKEGHWFRARSYNGPWVGMDRRHVPGEIVAVPRDYRKIYAREHHVPYGQLKKHWRERDIERREHRGEWRAERGEDRKEMKKEEKEHRKEMKKEEKERRKEMKEHGRGHD